MRCKLPAPVASVLKRSVCLVSLLALCNCSQAPEVSALGPRATQWVGPERKLVVRWLRVVERAPLRDYVAEHLNRGGIAVLESEFSADITIAAYSIGVQNIAEPMKFADFLGEYVGLKATEGRCDIMINTDHDGAMLSVRLDYSFVSGAVSVGVVASCLNKILEK